MGFLVACAIGVAIGLALVWANARAAITIAVLEIERGVVRVTRGGLAARILGDVRDIAARPPIPSATIRVIRAKDHARLEIHGDVPSAQVQRLRNVIGSIALAQLARAPRR